MKNQLFKSLFLPLFVLIGLSIPFWFTDLDIWAQQPFFDTQKGWYMAEIPIWEFIYKYGIFLGYLLALVALIVISVSYWKTSFIYWRKPAIFLLFVLAIGPGILINLTFKDQWGRPRPRDIEAFGGVEAYVAPGAFGQGNGKSFPCGHCSMGFFMAVPFLFLRKKYHIWGYLFLIFGLLYGSLIGLARMMAGGHFLSDVIWSGGIVWIVAVLGYHLLKLDQEVVIPEHDASAQKRKARRATLVMGILLPILTISLLLATPYISRKEFYKTSEELHNSKVIHTKIEEGNLTITSGEKLQINYRVNAFGFPNSKLRSRWIEGDTSVYWIEKLGWFTEVKNNFEITYPFGEDIDYFITVEEGNVVLEVPESTPKTTLHFQLTRGNLTIRGQNYGLTNSKGDMLNLSGNPLNESDQKALIKNILSPDSPFQIKASLDNGNILVGLNE